MLNVAGKSHIQPSYNSFPFFCSDLVNLSSFLLSNGLQSFVCTVLQVKTINGPDEACGLSLGSFNFTIYCHAVVFVQGGVVIVDSPGIGDEEKVSKVALEYLPQAYAFIYVINSSNAGGMQKDRVSFKKL